MSITIVDRYGNERIALNTLGGESVNDTRPNTVNVGALSAEVLMDIAGEEFSSIDIRGVFVGTMIPSFSVDGVNWVTLPIFNRNTETFQQGITAVGIYQLEIPTGAKRIRLVMTAYTSGMAVVAMTANVGNAIIYAKPIPSNMHATNTGVVGAAVTNTLPAVAGMYHYITAIKIEKFAVAALTPAATPVLVTTTNLVGARAYSMDASAQAAGTIIKEREQFSPPIKSISPGVLTSIIAPIVANGIWRISVDYYVGM